MADKGKPAKRPKTAREESGPEIRIGPPANLGRRTLEDIELDAKRAPWPRAPLSTISYEEGPPPPQPQPMPPRPLKKPIIPRVTSTPEIEIRLTNAGRDTLSAIDEGEGELDDPPPQSEDIPKADALELRTFVVPSTSLSPRATDDQKRAFVRERLAHRLPCAPGSVRRVDAKLLEPGAVVLRVWCPVD